MQKRFKRNRIASVNIVSRDAILKSALPALPCIFMVIKTLLIA